MSADIDGLLARLRREAAASGYLLNPDGGFTRELVEGLAVNRERYGYPSCPCRLAEGDRALDLDIVCPCDYRDADLSEHGCCFCALYVSPEVAAGTARAVPIPERRPSREERDSAAAEADGSPPEALRGLSLPVWRCTVCGYLCARTDPPALCPVCKAGRDRFRRFL